MRTLTLGVIIATGGTLAALPFRKAENEAPTAIEPTHSTGPIGSVLDPIPVRVVQAPSSTTRWPPSPTSLAATPVSSILREAPSIDSFTRQRGTGSQQSFTEADSRVAKPLTFEDLMKPIELPAQIKQKYDAVAGFQKDLQEAKKEADRAMEMPSMSELRPDLREQLESRFGEVGRSETSVARSNAVASAPKQFTWLERDSETKTQARTGESRPSSVAAGSLASATVTTPRSIRQDQSVDQLPQPAKAREERLWIRQP